MEKKRLTSVKSRIAPVKNGKYVAQEVFPPNYVLTPGGAKISRVRVLATVVDKFISEGNKFASITLDDGTDTIRARAFNGISIFDGIDIGTTADVVARVREYQGEIYLMPEV